MRPSWPFSPGSSQPLPRVLLAVLFTMLTARSELSPSKHGKSQPAAGVEFFSVPYVCPPQASKILDVHLPPVHFAAKIDSKRGVSDISTHVPCLPFIAGAQQGMWWGLMSKNFSIFFSQTRKVAKKPNSFPGWGSPGFGPDPPPAPKTMHFD